MPKTRNDIYTIMYIRDQLEKSITPNTLPNEIDRMIQNLDINIQPKDIVKYDKEIKNSHKKLKELILLSIDFDPEYKKELRKKLKKELPKTKVLIDK